MSFISPHIPMCACVLYMCAQTWVHLCTHTQSPRLVPAIILHYSSTILNEQGLSSKCRACSLLWGFPPPPAEAGIPGGHLQGSFGTLPLVLILGWPMLLPLSQPPVLIYLIKKFTLMSWERSGERSIHIEVKEQFVRVSFLHHVDSGYAWPTHL